MSVHNLDNLVAQAVAPEFDNVMVKHWAQFFFSPLGLRPAGWGPGLARAINQGRLGGQAGIIRQSLRLGDSVRVGFDGAVTGWDVAAEAQRGEGSRRGSGWGDGGIALVKRALSAEGNRNGFSIG